jgi:hypothetical protein
LPKVGSRHTGLFHPAQGDINRHYARGTAAISNYLYFITIAHHAQRRIGRADVIGVELIHGLTALYGSSP